MIFFECRRGTAPKKTAQRFLDRIALERARMAADPFRAWLTRLSENGVKEVATIGCMAEGCLLMGKRRDNDRWTTPGGHLNAGETPEQAAKRELAEEANIEADEFHLLGSDDVETFTGKQIKVHCFRSGFASKVPADNSRDPDKEVSEWVWQPISYGLSDEILSNLHSPKNALLRRLGLQKEEGSHGDA